MTALSAAVRGTPAVRDRQNPLSVGGATLFMILFGGYFLAPIWWLVVTASKTRAELRTSRACGSPARSSCRATSATC